MLQSQLQKWKQKHGVKSSQMCAIPDQCAPGRTELPLSLPKGHLSSVDSGTRTGGL